MGTLDDILVALHILAAVTWVGGAITLQAWAQRTLAAKDPRRLATFMTDVDYIGQRLYLTASLVLIVTGVWLVSRDVFELAGWVWFGIAVWTYSFVSGAVFLGPESGRVGKLIATDGADTPAVQQRIRRLLMLARVELVLLILVVIDMSVKPGA